MSADPQGPAAAFDRLRLFQPLAQCRDRPIGSRRHFEETTLLAGRDDNGNENAVQQIGSSLRQEPPETERRVNLIQKPIIPNWRSRVMERVKGIEPSSSAWKAVALPLSYTRSPGAVVGEVGLEPTKA